MYGEWRRRAKKKGDRGLRVCVLCCFMDYGGGGVFFNEEIAGERGEAWSACWGAAQT